MRLASSRAIRVAGICVLLAFAMALYLSLTASKGLPGQSFRHLSADFADVGGLREGDDVRTASVRIGQVTQITYSDGKAHVDMQIDPDEDVFEDASATVVARSALGQNFVMIRPGSSAAGQLPDGAKLEDSSVTSPINLDQVLSVLDPATRRATSNLIIQVGRGTAGHSEDIADLLDVAPDLLADLRTVAGTLADPGTDLSSLLEQTRTLATRFEGHTDHVGQLLTHLNATVDALAVDDGGAIDQTLQNAPAALTSTSRAMEDLEGPLDDLGTGMRVLGPGADALGQATPDLRAVLREGVRPLGKVPGVAREADPAVRSLSDVVLDARPLAARLTKTFASARRPTAVLAPYMPEFMRFFEYWDSANRFGDASGHYLRIALVVRPESITGQVPVPDPLVHRDPYPAPGTAEGERASSILGGQ